MTIAFIVMKKSLRKYIRSQKQSFSIAQLDDYSEVLCEKLLLEASVAYSKVVLAYYPLPDEVSIVKVIETLVNDGKRVLLPEVVSDNEMILREYHSDTQLKEGAYNILEPTGDVFTNYQDIDVAIIPGMAFDKNGNRLGRGKGYYDRFLSKVKQSSGKFPYLIGVCFPFQLVEQIPHDDNDIPVDKVMY